MATNKDFRAHKVSILQIGDIHYPDHSDAEPTADIKADPMNAKKIIAPTGHLFEEAVRLLLSQAKRDIAAILFVGDLTTAGDVEGFTAITRKLTESILPTFYARADFNKHVLVTPGNHDVDWPKCIEPRKTEEDFLEKFAPYHDILTKHGLTNFPLAKPAAITVGGSLPVNIVAINTCLGCGELRLFPDAVKKEVRKLLNRILKRRGAGGKLTKDDIEILTERLDAPVISKEALSSIDEMLFMTDDQSKRAFNVILGHHNLLPQLVPRIAPFGELMNAGQLRGILSRKECPVIYLHGHIHDDPVEILINQSAKEGGVFSISAPLFLRGFNRITFWFDSQKRPLGTEISPYRLDEHATRTKQEAIRIPFHFGHRNTSGLSVLARKIIGALDSNKRVQYLEDICRVHKNEDRDNICHALHELSWRDAVDISNPEDPPEDWIIRFEN